MTPGDRVAHLYPQALGTHFSRLLRHARVTVDRSLILQQIHSSESFRMLLAFKQLHDIHSRSSSFIGRCVTVQCRKLTVLWLLFCSIDAWVLFVFPAEDLARGLLATGQCYMWKVSLFGTSRSLCCKWETCMHIFIRPSPAVLATQAGKFSVCSCRSVPRRLLPSPAGSCLFISVPGGITAALAPCRWRGQLLFASDVNLVIL
jgi:hypothetical protein